MAGTPGPGYPIRGEVDIFTGPQGAHTLGKLCNRCEDAEIEAYHGRLKTKTTALRPSFKQTTAAANTCKCEIELGKDLCFRDRQDALQRIQLESASNAGPDGWLAHLHYAPTLGRARYVRDAALYATLQRSRRTNGKEPSACRCGRSIPLRPLAAGSIPRPVAMCTACSGMIVEFAHPRIRDWVPPSRQPRGTTETNMELGRNVPDVPVYQS